MNELDYNVYESAVIFNVPYKTITIQCNSQIHTPCFIAYWVVYPLNTSVSIIG